MAQETGITPEALVSRPRLSELLNYLVARFNEISRDRTYAMDTPLKLTTFAIEFYRTTFDIPFDRDSFHGYIRMIDDTWYVEMMKKRDKPTTPQLSHI